jgi:hypothetical protein
MNAGKGVEVRQQGDLGGRWIGLRPRLRSTEKLRPENKGTWVKTNAVKVGVRAQRVLGAAVV